ncbi:hypothetical protein CY34DRAFT_810507 [Suillus luteus UH-Slu-Lm8-n1]|uniref:Uncharacterized protein n=1 Tax=Suillus luteus UH-Slu-Lm8-n1 TaxID=930992 RepID=A0A0D0AGH1_9AGAM|nr:hypothetical protein CY34DRAFT_810507 [Suillus luteus UH-Slu-Lm8-n1]
MRIVTPWWPPVYDLSGFVRSFQSSPKCHEVVPREVSPRAHGVVWQQLLKSQATVEGGLPQTHHFEGSWLFVPG